MPNRIEQEPVVLARHASVAHVYLAELRDTQRQHNRQRFRLNMSRLSELLAYEISKALDYTEEPIHTPLGSTTGHRFTEQPVLVGILRAGLAMQEGFLRMFDDADNGFISAFRRHTTGGKFIIQVEYASCPPLDNRVLILLDPMIATGQSMVLSYKSLIEQRGTPARVIIASVIASEQGIDYVQRHLPHAELYVGAIDPELTAKAYIVPGLGDAGDLAYGLKYDEPPLQANAALDEDDEDEEYTDLNAIADEED
jgi:uracil phosphoribosyltransferase